MRLLDVVEPPPMTGLPPVTGTITQTVHLVEDPGLPDPPPPLPALPVDDPAVLARMAEMQAKHRGIQIAFVSATVYDHSPPTLNSLRAANASQAFQNSTLNQKLFSISNAIESPASPGWGSTFGTAVGSQISNWPSNPLIQTSNRK